MKTMRGSKVLAMVVAAITMAGLVACTKSVVRTHGRTSASPVPTTSVQQPGVSVTVQRGDTLYSLSRANKITPQDLAAWNGLSTPYTIYPGQRLRLYPSSGSTASATRPATSGTASTTTTTPTPVASTAPASSGFSWTWPTTGNVVTQYVVNDTTRQGIDIAGQSGQPVLAAANGTVVYSGAGLVGYGELIIIKHNDDWLSAYGHNSKRLVNEGQSVRAGQQIAEMGRTGASRDMLHFEIRYKGKPVDPQAYLPRR
ncbi:MAG: peptidoglycan DD-metalloendopeptidase family protein [Xanthomonadaceae bacterium]|jgi:lipoprotein NlpD|nr:peptidoglycan DD-metalloendopeptidase family protein [Xanthomonadaceae bacterium]